MNATHRAFGAVLLAVAAATGATAAAAEQTHTFIVRHHTVGEAAMLVIPMLSARGTISTDPVNSALRVTDEEGVVRRVAMALARWDLDPPAYRVRVRLIRASSEPGGGGQVPGLPTGLPSGLFRFSSYREVGKLEALLLDRNSIEAGLGQPYRVRFTVRSLPGKPERVQLSRLELFHIIPPVVPNSGPRSVLRSNVSLELGQTVVLAAAQSESAREALLLVLAVEHEKSE